MGLLQFETFLYFLPWKLHATARVWKKVEKMVQKWQQNGEFSFCLVAKRVKCEFDIAFIMPSEIIQWLQSRWHSPYILVYKHPLLTYLLVSVPSILTLRYSGSQVWEDFLGVRKVTRSRWLRPFQWSTDWMNMSGIRVNNSPRFNGVSWFP